MIAGLWSSFTGSRFYGWIIGAVAALGAIAAIYFKGRSAGKEVVRKEVQKRDVEEAKAHAETIREVADAQSNVVRMSDRQLDDRLRKWTRKAD